MEKIKTLLELPDGLPTCSTLLEFDYEQSMFASLRPSSSEVTHLGHRTVITLSPILGSLHVEAHAKFTSAVGGESDVEAAIALGHGRPWTRFRSHLNQFLVESTDQTLIRAAQGVALPTRTLTHCSGAPRVTC